MAISAYIGVPGSGKSYEAIANVIIPAYQHGRRIVTNIVGVNIEKIHDYCLVKKKCDATLLGEILVVSDEQVSQSGFFPSKENPDAFCQAGDLIVIDEAWRIFGSDAKLSDEQRSFIAEHRHFSHAKTGISCDLVIINQALTNVARFLKDRIETTYRMSKHKALGLTSRYRVDVFSGTKLFKSNKTISYQNKYDPDIFTLYSSYDGQNGTEKATDKRQSVFGSLRVKLFLIGFPILFLMSFYFLYQFFTRLNSTPETVDVAPIVQSIPADKLSFPVTTTTAKQFQPAISTEWRIAGRLTQNNRAFIVLSDSAGRLRLEPASQFTYSGLMTTGTIDNEHITFYSGRK